MLPSFVSTIVLAGEFVDVHLRVNAELLLAGTTLNDVTDGTSVGLSRKFKFKPCLQL